MEKIQIAISVLLLTAFLPALAQRVEPVPYGDFEQWTTRAIKESAIVGGNTCTLYTVGPLDKTIWASSNVWAHVMGVVQTSVTMEPDEGPTGQCARLSTRFASCRVAGMIDIKVLATGALYWGRMLEPVTGVKKPYSYMDWGIPFTGRPSALILDCKAELPATGILTKGTTFKQEEFPGEDPCQIMLILQYRWEEADGSIHAKRVATGVRRIAKSTGGWKKDFRVPLIYGDARNSASYAGGWELLSGRKTLYALNSRGQKKPIIEEGWADENTPCTHAVLQITAGCHGAFIGALGNTMWVDNIRLEYPE